MPDKLFQVLPFPPTSAATANFLLLSREGMWRMRFAKNFPNLCSCVHSSFWCRICSLIEFYNALRTGWGRVFRDTFYERIKDKETGRCGCQEISRPPCHTRAIHCGQ